MACVFDVASFFIQVANQNEDDQITNLKLNKLLYYAQGAYIARSGKPLFDACIEAWPLGPVVPEIYQKYKVCGKSPICFIPEDFNISCFSSDELDALLDVEREYGQYTGAKLVSLTHAANSPWSTAVNSGKTIIDIASIRSYFLSNPVPTLMSQTTLPVVEKLPADWYFPEEDAEWEAYM